jgi:hypothetical protein
MGIIVLSRDYGNNPSIVRMVSTDDFATISAAGYLDAQLENIIAINGGPFQWQPSDFILCYFDVSPPYFTGGAFSFFSLSADNSSLQEFTVPGAGTITQINTNNGVTGGPITTTGTIGLATIASHTLLANATAGVAVPTSTTLTALIDAAIGSTQGDMLYRNAATWVVLAPGTSGQILQTKGAAANPAYTTATYPATTTINQLLYSSAANTVAGLATLANGVLVTDGTGIPSISTTLPAGLTIPGYQPTITILDLAHGGTNANLTANNGGIFYSTATAGAILAGTATANQALLSGSSAAPAWSTATYPATTTINQLLYSSAANTITGLATLASGVLVTSAGGVPSISTTLPAGLTIPGYQPTITPAALTKTDDTNVTLTLGGTPTTALLQATSLTLGWTGQLGLTRGGTAASLTANVGGIVYSTASALAILAGTATANQIVMSGSSAAPAWSTATYPATTTINQILYSSAANTVTGIATVNSAGLLTNGSGVPAWVAATGTGAPVLATSPTLVTPNLGAATATSMAFSPTTGGIIGTATNDNAAAGKVGEFVSSVITSNTVTINTTTATDITSISLTAGDWDVWGNIIYTISVGVSAFYAWTNTASATPVDGSLANNVTTTTAILTSGGIQAPYRRISIASTTSVFLTAFAIFASGTVKGGGGIFARRVR